MNDVRYGLFAFGFLASSIGPLNATSYDCSELLRCSTDSEVALNIASVLRDQGNDIDWDYIKKLEEQKTYIQTLRFLSCEKVSNSKLEDLYQEEMDKIRDRVAFEDFPSILVDYVRKTNRCLSRTKYFE